MNLNVVIAIGNSDDFLTQKEWKEYTDTVDKVVWGYSFTTHGRWFSEPASEYQNAAWSFEIPEINVEKCQKQLASVALDFGQNSIAWLSGQTEFIEGVKRDE